MSKRESDRGQSNCNMIYRISCCKIGGEKGWIKLIQEVAIMQAIERLLKNFGSKIDLFNVASINIQHRGELI